MTIKSALHKMLKAIVFRKRGRKTAQSQEHKKQPWRIVAPAKNWRGRKDPSCPKYQTRKGLLLTKEV